jgi:hypothetical protein
MFIVTVIAATYLLGADFPICTYSDYQIYPCARYENGQYYVFWTDYRSVPYFCLYGARVDVNGTVLDPNGKFLFEDSVFSPRAAYDGSNFLVVWREGC